jgi:hypothetical protein
MDEQRIVITPLEVRGAELLKSMKTQNSSLRQYVLKIQAFHEQFIESRTMK